MGVDWTKVAALYSQMIQAGEISIPDAALAMSRSSRETISVETASKMIGDSVPSEDDGIIAEIEYLDRRAAADQRAKSFIHYAEVLLRNPEGYETDGRMFVVLDGLEWGRVEYREPEMCGCSIESRMRAEGLVPHNGSPAAHDALMRRQEQLSTELGVDGPGSTMCRSCRDSWECDHEVRGPWLI